MGNLMGNYSLLFVTGLLNQHLLSLDQILDDGLLMAIHAARDHIHHEVDGSGSLLGLAVVMPEPGDRGLALAAVLIVALSFRRRR